MFCSLRFLFIALMIVLLPLRGWAGNVMAVSMAATAVQAKMDSNTSQALMPPDCAMHSQPSTNDAAAYCSNCDTCELCLAVANLTQASRPASQLTQHFSPLAFDASFSSSARTSKLKPPIS